MALLLRKEIHMIYKITLFDANFPSCTSGTASFFTEDIDEFEHNYFSDENVESNQLEAQKQRYFRSKACIKHSSLLPVGSGSPQLSSNALPI